MCSSRGSRHCIILHQFFLKIKCPKTFFSLTCTIKIIITNTNKQKYILILVPAGPISNKTQNSGEKNEYKFAKISEEEEDIKK